MTAIAAERRSELDPGVQYCYCRQAGHMKDANKMRHIHGESAASADVLGFHIWHYRTKLLSRTHLGSNIADETAAHNMGYGASWG